MPIPVVCPGCSSRFTVSDQYAGRTGPCPKCKKPITIPAAPVKSVVIHEPEKPATTSAAGGRPPTAPIRRTERPIPVSRFAAVGGGVLVLMLAAWAVSLAFPGGQAPAWLLIPAAFVVAVPCAMLGYQAVRDRELEPYRGRDLWLRSLACGAVYAGLWCLKGFLPEDATREMWQWLYLGPLFFFPGSLAAVAALDLDWGPAAAQFSFYVLLTAALRWLAGLMPV